MNGSFNALAQTLNVQRLYEKAFDQVMISPTPLWQFIAGQIIGGSLRGVYAGSVIILLVLPLRTGLCFNGWSFLFMFLNGAVFSTIGVVVSFYAKNHADVPRFSNYVIMPMAYLCNTFFSAQNMPDGIRQLISWLPLSQTSAALRQIANQEAFLPHRNLDSGIISGLLFCCRILVSIQKEKPVIKAPSLQQAALRLLFSGHLPS